MPAQEAQAKYNGEVITKLLTEEQVLALQDGAMLGLNSDNEVIIIETEMSKTAYARKRAGEYPELREQFDLLWHDIENETLDKSGRFYKAIQTIKIKYPKNL